MADLMSSLAPTPSGGFWPTSMDDPRLSANLALAAGLIAGRPADAFAGYGAALGPDAQLKRAQIEDTRQQIGLRNLQLQQQQRVFDLQTPFLEMALARMRARQGQPAGAMPGASAPAAVDAPTSSQVSTLPLSMNAPTGGASGASAGQGPAMPPGGMAPAMQPGQPQSGAPQGAQSMFPGVPDDVALTTIGVGGMQALPGLLSKYNEPTEFMKTLQAARVDPDSAIGRQLILSNIAKTNYIAPTALRTPIYFDPLTQTTKVVPEEQLRQGYGAQYEAEARGKALQTPTTRYVKNPDGSISPVFSTQAQDVDMARGGPVGAPGVAPAGVSSSGYGSNGVSVGASATRADRDQTLIYQKEYADSAQRLAQAQADLGKAVGPANTQVALQTLTRAQQDMAGLQREMKRLNIAPTASASAPPPAQTGGGAAAPNVMPTLPPGAETGQNDAQKTLTQRWSSLQDMNSQAQTTASYLESIKQLAPKAAVGQFADKQQLVNSLLSYAGVSDKATDEVTAKNLLDKYSQQIVSRLGGSGGLSTDAARAILQAANPNSHMTPDALAEAVDNLVGANNMIQAKTRFLQEAGNSRNPTTYSQREVVFDQNADPRIWQLANMPTEQAQKFLAAMPAQMRADLTKRAKALRDAGAL